MSLQSLLDITAKKFQKKNKESDLAFNLAKDEKPPNGLVLDNPLFEYIFDRRAMPFGRFYLVYGKKGSSKTSLFYEMAKIFQANQGDVIWLETENAADLKYAASQGVDLSRLAILHPKSLEEALNLAEDFIRNMPAAYPDGNTPVLICLDSIAGSATEYELDQKHNITDMMPGMHARLLSRWYREMEGPLANEKCIFLALNQQKASFGQGAGMSFGDEAPESLMGGNAPLFSSTCQFKISRTKDLTAENEYGADRKIGSRHKMVCKRNKLGREGNSQWIEFDLYIKDGIDWWGPLVRTLAEHYTPIVGKEGAGWYRWKPENTECTVDGQTGIIDVEQNYREKDLGNLIRHSTQAKEIIRKAFEIPELPSDTILQEVEKERLTKRKRKKTLADEQAVL